MSRIDRNKRERKLERRKLPAPARVHNPDPVNSAGRGSTFRAARVRREVAKELPGILYSAPDKPKRATRKAPLTTRDPVEPSRPANKARQAAKPERAKPEQLTIRDERPTCKRRPSSTGGDGSSRPFVPWC